MNASIYFKSRCRPIHLDQVEHVVPWPAVALAKAAQRVGSCGSAARSFLCYQSLGKLAFSDSIVLRTRRSTLVYV
jgi:hypothetical protein